MQTSCKWRPTALAGLVLVAMQAIGLSAAQGQEQVLNAALAEQQASDVASVKSQTRVAQLSDQTTELLGEFRVKSQELDRVRLYNNHLQKLVDDQEAQKADIQNQLDNFVVVQQEIIPLMFDMIDRLEQFIDMDVPFNLEERQERVTRLRENMDSSEITISEKYRNIMEAYRIETDFGRDTEAFPGQLEGRQVNFLRIGRVLLAYQTPDQQETGFWNKNTRQWELLPDQYRSVVQQGLRIARRQAAPELLRLPVSSAEAG